MAQVPILRTTGVNTKLLPALQLGVPTVLTTVAASPLGVPTDDSVMLIADDASAFVQQLVHVATSQQEQRRLSSAAQAHWRRLLHEDASASDLLPLLQYACSVLHVAPDMRPMPRPVVPAPGAT